MRERDEETETEWVVVGGGRGSEQQLPTRPANSKSRRSADVMNTEQRLFSQTLLIFLRQWARQRGSRRARRVKEEGRSAAGLQLVEGETQEKS